MRGFFRDLPAGAGQPDRRLPDRAGIAAETRPRGLVSLSGPRLPRRLHAARETAGGNRGTRRRPRPGGSSDPGHAGRRQQPGAVDRPNSHGGTCFGGPGRRRQTQACCFRYTCSFARPWPGIAGQERAPQDRPRRRSCCRRPGRPRPALQRDSQIRRISGFGLPSCSWEPWPC